MRKTTQPPYAGERAEAHILGGFIALVAVLAGVAVLLGFL